MAQASSFDRLPDCLEQLRIAHVNLAQLVQQLDEVPVLLEVLLQDLNRTCGLLLVQELGIDGQSRGSVLGVS